jgi:catechol 2,3-dioxygenase-like lactoylglutathione lyase family enzyme
MEQTRRQKLTTLGFTLGFTVFFIAAATVICCEPASAQIPFPSRGRCGDGICGPVEKAHPEVCPRDCPEQQSGRDPGPGTLKRPGSPCGDGRCDDFEKTHPRACPQDCREAAESPPEPPRPHSFTFNETSPFGIHNPSVIDRPLPPNIKKLPPGFDTPEDIYAAGARWARYSGKTGLAWDLVEKEPGVYDWSRYDLMFSQAAAAGVNLLVDIHAYNKRDRPDAVIKKGIGVAALLPNDMDGFLAFLEKAVERYDGDGVDDAPGSPVVKYWAVENEVDLKLFWGDTPENYAELLRQSYSTIKQANHQARVVMAGMSDPLRVQESYAFFSKVFAALNAKKTGGRDRFFDVLSFHLYNFESNLIARTQERLAFFKEQLKQGGYPYVPVWITETGDYSGKPAENNLTEKAEKLQAENLVKIYVHSLANGVSKIFWVTLTEWSGYGGKNSVWDNVGLINNPETDGESHKKSAYHAFRNMAGMLEDSDWDNIETVRQEDDVFIYKFRKSGNSIWVAWSDRKTPTNVTLRDIKKDVAYMTPAIPPTAAEPGQNRPYTGTVARSSLKVDRGSVSVPLSGSPVFILEE